MASHFNPPNIIHPINKMRPVIKCINYEPIVSTKERLVQTLNCWGVCVRGPGWLAIRHQLRQATNIWEPNVAAFASVKRRSSKIFLSDGGKTWQKGASWTQHRGKDWNLERRKTHHPMIIKTCSKNVLPFQSFEMKDWLVKILPVIFAHVFECTKSPKVYTDVKACNIFWLSEI